MIRLRHPTQTARRIRRILLWAGGIIFLLGCKTFFFDTSGGCALVNKSLDLVTGSDYCTCPDCIAASGGWRFSAGFNYAPFGGLFGFGYPESVALRELTYGAVLLLLGLAGRPLFRWITNKLAYDPDRCEHCGYDLRGLPEPRCPECGSPPPPDTPDFEREPHTPTAS